MTRDRRRGIEDREQPGRDGPYPPPRQIAAPEDMAVLSAAQAGLLLLQQSAGNRATGSFVRRASQEARLAMLERRARTLLDRHFALARDALRAFPAAAVARLGRGREQITDAAGLAGALAAVAADTLATALPELGGLVGASLAMSLEAAGRAQAGPAAEASAERALRHIAAASEQGLRAGFRKAGSALPARLSRLATAVANGSAVVEGGSQDEMDAVIAVELGISDPERVNPYADLQWALEDEFERWLKPQDLPESADTEAALAPPASADDEAGRKQTPTQAQDKTGKAH